VTTEEAPVRIFAWLFGNKQKAVVAPPVDREDREPEPEPEPAAVNGLGTPAVGQGVDAPPSEAHNLKRWRESGQARVWVEAHRGGWNHDDWLTLLDELGRSPFWPMQPDAVGQVLEDEKRQWLSRN
jgi:hypothetical protein